LGLDATTTRKKLWALLGDIPSTFIPEVTVLSRTEYGMYSQEHISFKNGVGDTVYGYVLIPFSVPFTAPAILYHHVHGGKYHLGKEGMLIRRDNGFADGIMLVKAGFIVLAIDAYAFGERQTQGPAGEAESGAETELSLFKHFLWQGKTLWGMMLHDDLLALAYLRSRPDVDENRIGTTGMSLGGSRSTWVSALDTGIKATIPIAQLTRYQDFADSGNYRLHSVYYYVPAMLTSGIDMEHIVALSAPRYQHILIGDSDPLSPISGVHKIVNYARNIYGDTPFDVTIYEGVGHNYTNDMVKTMRDSFLKHL